MYKILFFAIIFGSITTSSNAQHKGCNTIERGPKANFLASTSDTTKPRGLADNYFLWDLGSVIKVKFLSGSPYLQDRIKTCLLYTSRCV